jgi:Protein of unknown function (DUF664)
MDLGDVLVDLYDRIEEHVHEAVDGLDAEMLATSPAPGTNPVGWLVWHLTRVQDHHVAQILGEDQVWVTDGWAARFGLDADPSNTGYGHTDDEVAAVRPDGADVLVGYYLVVATRTRDLLDRLTPDELDRVVDRRWDPPVTLGVRLISIADDDIQHAGQAVYARGMLQRAASNEPAGT